METIHATLQMSRWDKLRKIHCLFMDQTVNNSLIYSSLGVIVDSVSFIKKYREKRKLKGKSIM